MNFKTQNGCNTHIISVVLRGDSSDKHAAITGGSSRILQYLAPGEELANLRSSDDISRYDSDEISKLLVKDYCLAKSLELWL